MQFPGALRELDDLETAELTRRAEVLEAAARGDAAPADWMVWMHGYRVLMRAALRLRRHQAGGGAVGPAELLLLSQETGVLFDEELVAAITTPPSGRIMVAVFGHLSAAYGVPARTLWDTLFPPRRGARDYR